MTAHRLGSLLVLACSIAPLAAQEQPAQITDIAGMRDLDARAPFVCGFHAPGRAMASAHAEVLAILREPFRERVEAADEEVEHELGFSLIDGAAWRAHGIDPDGDHSLSLCDPGGFFTLPREKVALLTLTDASRFSESLLELVRMQQGEDTVLVHHTMPDFDVAGAIAWKSFGRRCLLVSRTRSDSDRLIERMPLRIAAMGASESIGAREVYRLTRKEMARPAIAGMYVRPAEWRDADQEDAPPKPDDYETMVALGEDGLVVTTVLPEAAREPLSTPTDADVRGMIEAFPRPDLACAVCISAPIRAGMGLFDWRAIEAELGPLVQALPRAGEIRGFGLLGWMTPRREGAPFDFALGYVARDVETARVVVGRMREVFAALPGNEEAREGGLKQLADLPEGARAWSVLMGQSLVTLAQRGDRVLIGTGSGPILAALRGERAHESALGTASLFEAVVELPPLITMFAPEAFVDGAMTGRLRVSGRVEGLHAILNFRREGGERPHSILAEIAALLYAM